MRFPPLLPGTGTFRHRKIRLTDHHCYCRLIGKAAYKLTEPEQAQTAYRTAIQINASGPAAWMGLAELADASDDVDLSIEANIKLVGAFILLVPTFIHHRINAP